MVRDSFLADPESIGAWDLLETDTYRKSVKLIEIFAVRSGPLCLPKFSLYGVSK
jgi:hypothetical protein